jgi:hypothetical protein
VPAVTNKAPDLIKAGGIPCLRYHLGARKNWIRLDVPNDRRPGHRRSGLIAREDGGEIKAEPVYVHVCNPITETVQDHSAHNWLIGIQSIAGAGVIRVPATVVFKDVVCLVLKAAKAERRAAIITLCGVVEDHVQDYLEYRPGAGL